MKLSGKSPTHLDLIRQLPCLLSGRPAEAAHIRYADAKYKKPEAGLGAKPDDKWTVPLCPELHRLVKGCQHDGNERMWWRQFRVDPLQVASELYGQPLIVMQRVIIRRQPWDAGVTMLIRQLLQGGK